MATVALKEATIGPVPKSTCSAPAPTTNSAPSATENPVPSITLSITQDDVKRVLEASESLSKKLTELQGEQDEPMNTTGSASPIDIESFTVTPTAASSADTSGVIESAVDSTVSPSLRPAVSTSEDEGSKDNSIGAASSRDRADCKGPLHELIYQAARACENSMLQSFIDRMKYSGCSTREVKAGVMVFSEMDLNSKIKRFFDVLGEEKNCQVEIKVGEDKDDEQGKSLGREGALSLFRAVIVAIASCIQKNARVQIEMGDKENGEQPRVKRRKPNTPPDGNSSRHNFLKTVDAVPSLQTPTVSFDNSAVAIKEEEDLVEKSSVRKEFEEIAVYATDRLVKFALKKSGNVGNSDGVTITFAIFQSWRRAEGARIAPWLDLLNLSRWKTPQRSAVRSSAPPVAKPQPQQQATTQKPPSQPVLPQPVPDQPKNNAVAAVAIKKSQSSESLALVKEAGKPPVPQQREEQDQNQKVDASKTNEPLTNTAAAQTSEQGSNQAIPYCSDKASRTVLSFDFPGSLPEDETEKSFCITISEENLKTFRSLVERTGLINRSCHEITSILLEASKTRIHQGVERKVIPIERFHTCLHQLLGSGSSRRLSKLDRDIFASCFVDFFGCFTPGLPPLEPGEAYTHELAVGFCFLCAGNKSSKLATGFEFLESQIGGGLTNTQLVHFLRSYLTMLAGISFLTSSNDGIMKPKMNGDTRKLMYSAVENGARWTLNHFLKDIGLPENDPSEAKHTFENFAAWYSNGGFNHAPWLELLDLKKLLSLVDEPSQNSPAVAHDALPTFPGLKASSPGFISPRAPQSYHSTHRHPHPQSAPHHHHHAGTNGLHLTPFSHTHPPPSVQVLFTFPLANQCSLVVLKEDAAYVRDVVDHLGLLPFPPEEIWSTFYSLALKRPSSKKQPKSLTTMKTMLINKATFVDCMQETIRKKVKSSKKRTSSGHTKSVSNTLDVLTNLFRSFDLVQIDQVALNELMGGLTLLCGGKKSTKLSFAFSLFDRRDLGKKKGRKNQPKTHSLDGEELFLFLRSFLIITFSCCRQSLDLSDDAVNRYIADTANMVTDNVMKYQWETRKKNRVDFDEFGQWYNKGGYETAPWLELLDLTKWVLVENFDTLEKHCPSADISMKQAPPPPSPGFTLGSSLQDPDCPPAPPDADVDPSFFDDDDANNILPVDTIDEMDLLLLQQSSQEKEDAEISKLVRSFPYSPKPSPRAPAPPPRSQNSLALKFHIVIDDNHEGYVFSISQKRISHLRHVLMECGLHKIDCERAAKEILGKAFRDTKSSSRGSTYVLTKDGFDSAMRKVIVSRNMSVDTQRTLSNLLNDIFHAFDYDGVGKANALDLTCGFTLLCHGKKSDKLEFAFETLDREKRGVLKRSDITRYLRSFLLILVKLASASMLDSDFIDDSMTKMNGDKCDSSISNMTKAVEMGCEWATVQAIKGGRGVHDTISFDDFAEWYTRVGHSNIPWVELLDLNKWVINANPSSSHAR